jgi:long-chain acyl-CoA synthetase
MSTFTTLWQAALARPKADFLVTPQGRYSYADLTAAVEKACGIFDAQNVAPGDRVLIASRDEFAAVSLFLGALLHGVVPVLLASDTRAARAARIADETGCLAIHADPAIAEAWALDRPIGMIRPAEVRRWPFGNGKTGWSITGLEAGPAAPRLAQAPEETAYLLFTSGTTQAPTGVVISRRNLLANLATVGNVLRLREGSRLFNDMVLAHADGLIQGPILAFALGATVVRAGGFALDRLEDWLNTVRRESCTHFITVPTVWSLIDRYAQHDDYFDAPEMELLASCAARLDAGLWDRLENRFGRALINEYGLTETVMSALYAGSPDRAGDEPDGGLGAKGTIGRPIDCEARVAPLSADEPDSGELQLSGDNVFPGYWKNPERTAAAFTADGWLRTGDIVRRRADGAFDYLGRIKTIINSGGLLIRPEEIDEAMLAHPLVTAAATVGLADEEFGEVAVTAVEVSAAIDEAALFTHASDRLERLKLPRRIFIVDRIPRGLSGKVQMGELAVLLGGMMQARKPDDERLPGAGDQAAAVMAIAAEVFRCDPAGLTPRSGPDDIAAWDSFNHMTLLVAVEAAFDIHIPLRRATSIRHLSDLIAAVAEARK